MVNLISKTVKAGLILSCGLAMVSAENLLTNSSFEEGAKGWQQWGAISTEHSYAGAKAMKVENKTNQWSGISQVVPILEGTSSITVSGWLKAENVQPGKEAWEQAQIVIEFLNNAGTPFEYYPDQTALVSGNQEWTYYERNYGVYPGASSVKIIAALGNATGIASFDQLSVVQHKEDGTVQKAEDLEAFYLKKQQKQNEAVGILSNGSFENGKSNWQIYNGVIAEEGQDDNASLFIDNKKVQWSGASQVLSLPEEVTQVVISGWVKTEDVLRGKEGWDKALINFEYQDNMGKLVGDHPEVIAEMEGTLDWNYFQNSYGVTDGSTQIKLFCQLCNAKGKAWFDNLKVVFYNKDGQEIK